MLGVLVGRELTISLRRGAFHLLTLAQVLVALALVVGADRLAQSAIPWSPPALGSTSATAPTGFLGAVASYLDAAILVGETAWLLLFCLVAVPAIAGPAIARERERGTLPVLLGTGATSLAIVGAKSAAVLAQVGVVLLTGLPALGLVFVFGNPAPTLLLGSLALLVAWCAAVAGLGLLCSALFRSSVGASVAAFVAGLGLLVGPAIAPAVLVELGLTLPRTAYRLNLMAALLSLHPDLGQKLLDLAPSATSLKAAGQAVAAYGPPWVPFVGACMLGSVVLALLASVAVARTPGRT